MGIQFAAERAVCPYCLCLHACGAWLPRDWFGSGCGTGRNSFSSRPVLGLAILILGQTVVFRHPYRVDADVVIPCSRRNAADASDGARSARQNIGRWKSVRPGPGQAASARISRADHFIVVLSDYTCEHCRVTHRTLESSEPAFGDHVGVIVLPVLWIRRPIRICRLESLSFAAGSSSRRTGVGCLLRQAGRVYGNESMAVCRGSGSGDEAEGPRAYAEKLVGVQGLRAAGNDQRIRQIILTGCELFARSGSGVIPRMLIGKTQISGPVDDSKLLAGWVESEWGVRAGTPRSR